MPAIYHEGSWLGNATDPEVLVKDTVGWTGKNKLKNTATSRTVNGITFTVNADGSVVVNGTATADASLELITSNIKVNGTYILSGCPANGSTTTYGIQLYTTNSTQGAIFDIGNGYSFVETDYVTRCVIRIRNGQTVSNLTFYPMLRKADIIDPTYEPYHESVEVMYEEEIHGVNLLKNTASTQTINGVTFTVNTDGSVTINGTATNSFAFNICTSADNSQGQSLRGDFIASIGATKIPNGGEFSLQKNNLSSYWDMGSSRTEMVVKFTDSEYWSGRVHIYCTNGSVWNNIRIYPMLRKADIDDPTYRPYNEQAIQNQLNAQGVLGAKNLMPNNATSQTINGVTFTVNDDGSITGVGASNSSDMAYFVVGSGWGNSGKLLSETEIKAGETYILSKGFVKSGIALFIRFYQGSTDLGGISTKDEDNKKFTVPTNTDHIVAVIRIDSGVTISNSNVFYPMLRLASDPDDTYQPYAMTNRELTEKVFDKRTLTSADDLNNVTETGIYHITTSPANAPDSMTYCTLLVSRRDDTDIQQVIYRAADSIGLMYIRAKGGNPSTWKSWYKFTGAVVS